VGDFSIAVGYVPFNTFNVDSRRSSMNKQPFRSVPFAAATMIPSFRMLALHCTLFYEWENLNPPTILYCTVLYCTVFKWRYSGYSMMDYDDDDETASTIRVLLQAWAFLK
jgi:hypothetical protein